MYTTKDITEYKDDIKMSGSFKHGKLDGEGEIVFANGDTIRKSILTFTIKIFRIYFL